MPEQLVAETQSSEECGCPNPSGLRFRLKIYATIFTVRVILYKKQERFFFQSHRSSKYQVKISSQKLVLFYINVLGAGLM